MNFNERLRTIRKEKGLTQAELAEKAGIAVNSIRLYEAGARLPKLDTIGRIAEVLGVKVAELMGMEGAITLSKIQFESEQDCYGEEILQYRRMVTAFSYLNHKGAEKAASAVEDLAKINEYRRDEDKF